jgi:SAM-dependent methyltransferase
MGTSVSADALPSGGLALAAYESLAPFYDRFTQDYEYERWLEEIETWALAHGLESRNLLDVACGTGKSFEPMLNHGYAVTACDISPAMVARARRKSAGAADVVVADMRRLPWRSQFHLMTCLDDAVNYLLEESDLMAALSSMRNALRPGGILVFDTNSLFTYRTIFAEAFDVTSGELRFRWRGDATADFEPGGIATATIEVTGSGERTSSRHLQRHWPVEALRSACESAGLERVSFRGQMTGCRVLGDPDEGRHTKVLCLAARPDL